MELYLGGKEAAQRFCADAKDKRQEDTFHTTNHASFLLHFKETIIMNLISDLNSYLKEKNLNSFILFITSALQ